MVFMEQLSCPALLSYREKGRTRAKCQGLFKSQSFKLAVYNQASMPQPDSLITFILEDTEQGMGAHTCNSNYSEAETSRGQL